MWEVLPDDLEKAGADLSKLRLIPALRFVDLLDINAYSDPNEMGACGLATRPRDGVVVFNPFAIREIRFQLNNLINRKYVSYELLKGGGEPAFTYVSVSHPAWRYLKEIADTLGLREEGNELLALQRIREAMLNASRCVAKFGYSITLERDPTTGREVWTLGRPDGSKEPVKIVFLIRIEDERVEVTQGLGFLLYGRVIVDQHFLARGRFVRLLEAMIATGVRLGVGVDEDAAVVCTGSGRCRVIGTAPVVLVRLQDFNGTHYRFRLDYLSAGDWFDLESGEVSVDPGKRLAASGPLPGGPATLAGDIEIKTREGLAKAIDRLLTSSSVTVRTVSESRRVTYTITLAREEGTSIYETGYFGFLCYVATGITLYLSKS